MHGGMATGRGPRRSISWTASGFPDGFLRDTTVRGGIKKQIVGADGMILPRTMNGKKYPRRT